MLASEASQLVRGIRPSLCGPSQPGTHEAGQQADGVPPVRPPRVDQQPACTQHKLQLASCAAWSKRMMSGQLQTLLTCRKRRCDAEPAHQGRHALALGVAGRPRRSHHQRHAVADVAGPRRAFHGCSAVCGWRVGQRRGDLGDSTCGCCTLWPPLRSAARQEVGVAGADWRVCLGFSGDSLPAKLVAEGFRSVRSSLPQSLQTVSRSLPSKL